MKEDYITEAISDNKNNWRPRRTYIQKDIVYIKSNPTSVVSFNEFQEVYSLLINQIDRGLLKS